MALLQDRYDLLVIPGGAKGADTISNNKAVQDLVREYIAMSKMVGMICAGQGLILPLGSTLLRA